MPKNQVKRCSLVEEQFDWTPQEHASCVEIYPIL